MPRLRRQLEAICVAGPAPFDPTAVPALTRDPADDPIVFGALLAGSDFLISDDRDIVPDGTEHEYESTRVRARRAPPARRDLRPLHQPLVRARRLPMAAGGRRLACAGAPTTITVKGAQGDRPANPQVPRWRLHRGNRANGPSCSTSGALLGALRYVITGARQSQDRATSRSPAVDPQHEAQGTLRESGLLPRGTDPPPSRGLQPTRSRLGQSDRLPSER